MVNPRPSQVLNGGVASAPGDGFEIGYVGSDGQQIRLPMREARAVRFEYAGAAREFKLYKGMRHLPGRWWCSTTGGHVGYESWLERDHLIALDFNPAVTGIASQPFWLFWAGERGRCVSHAPDFFVRRGDGSALVVDCRPAERIKPRDAAKFEATNQACAEVGWDYRLVGALDAITVANVRWLAGYRHPRHMVARAGVLLREVFSVPRELMDGAEAVGDPVVVLPTLFHLLWRHDLVTDLSVPLHAGTIVRRCEGA